MANSNSQVHKMSDSRIFYQPGGAAPWNEVYLAAGEESAPIDITGVTFPTPTRTDVWAHDAYQRDQYQTIAETVEAPGGSVAGSVVFHYALGGIPKDLLKRGCLFTFYDAVGICGELSQGLDKAWSSVVRILAGGRINGDIDFGDLNNSREGTDLKSFTTPMKFREFYHVSSLNFALKASATIATEVLDVTYGTKVNCGDCGLDDDGTKLIYALVRPATGGKPYVLYYTDGGTSNNTSIITAAANDEVPVALRVVGKYLVVISPTAGGATTGGYYYAEIDEYGAPGTFSKVTTGFAATAEPRDIYVSGRNRFLLCCDGGVVYRVDDVLSGATQVLAAGEATTEDLSRIAGIGANVRVAGGTDGAVLISNTGGRTWSVVPTAPVASGTNITAVAVRSRLVFYVGTSAGTIYYTRDGGKTWTERKFPGSGSGTINDIRFVNDEVVYFAHTVGGAGLLYASINGLKSITNVANRVLNFPSVVGINRIAFPEAAITDIAANNLLVAGLGAASDGVLVQGVPTTV